jgi:hypothetical protein
MRSIISFIGEEVWYQLTGVISMMPCARTQSG